MLLVEQEQLEVEGAFIDGSFNSAKKGILELVRRSEEKGLSSWQVRMMLVFFYPYALQALRPTK